MRKCHVNKPSIHYSVLQISRIFACGLYIVVYVYIVIMVYSLERGYALGCMYAWAYTLTYFGPYIIHRHQNCTWMRHRQTCGDGHIRGPAYHILYTIAAAVIRPVTKPVPRARVSGAWSGADVAHPPGGGGGTGKSIISWPRASSPVCILARFAGGFFR